jgi:hypothetical protein
VPSSQDLHPREGARFLFEQIEPARWRVRVFLPAGESWQGAVAIDPDITLEIAPPYGEHWTAQEARKLARVLKRQPKAKLIRWRGAS